MPKQTPSPADLSPKQLAILPFLANDHLTRQQLASFLQRDPKTVKYHLRILIAAGLVQEQDHRVYRSYSLTPQGKQTLQLQNTSFPKPITRLHWYQLKFKILQDFRGTLPDGWEMGKDPKKWNWASRVCRLQTRLGEVFVEKTPRNFMVTLPRIITADPGQAERAKDQLAFAIHDWLIDQLPGLKLGVVNKEGEIETAFHKTKAHYGLPGDPLAKAAARLNLTMESDRIIVDNSPKKDKLMKHLGQSYMGEVEFPDRQWGKEDCYTLFNSYHDMIDGKLSASRIDQAQSVATGARQMAETVYLEIEEGKSAVQDIEQGVAEVRSIQNEYQKAIQAVTETLRIRDQAFHNFQKDVYQAREQLLSREKEMHHAFNELAYTVTILGEKLQGVEQEIEMGKDPVIRIKEQIQSFEDVNCGPVQRSLSPLTPAQKKRIKIHIGKLYW